MNSNYSFFLAAIFLVFLSQAIYAIPTTVSVSISSGTNFTNNPSVSLTITPDTQDANGMRFSCTAGFSGNFEAFASTKSAFDITTGNGCALGDGNKTVYVQLEDASGSQLASAEPAKIYLDTSSPTTIVSGNDGSWHQTNVTLTFSCTDTASGCSYVTVNGTDHNNYTANTAMLTISTEGSNSITYNSTDVAGNTDAPAPITVQIDKSGPSISNLFPANAGYDGNSSPTISFSLTDASSGIKASSIALAIDGNQKTPTANGSTYSFILDYSINSTKTVKVDLNAKDNLDNNSTSSWTFTVDKTPPSGTITLPDADVNITTPHLTLSATDSQIGMASGKMKFSCKTNNWSDPANYSTDYNGFNITSGSDCNSDQGIKIIHVRFADSAGNWATADANVQIIYDLAGPGAPNIFTATPGNGQATLNWTASTDSLSGIKDYVIYLNNSASAYATTSGISYTVTGLTNGTSYSFQIKARDNSGNEGGSISASATPTAGSTGNDNNPGIPSNQNDSSPPAIRWVNLQASQNLSGIFKVEVESIDDSGVNYTSLYVDSQSAENLVEKISVKKTAYFEFSIDTSKFSNGSHSLIAVSEDSSSNQNSGTSTITINFENGESGGNDGENNGSGDADENKTIFSQTTNFGEKDKNFINSISLEQAAKEKAIQLGELLKPRRKIEIAKNGGSFSIIVTISFENTDLNSIKIVEIIPKEFAKSASEIVSDTGFEILNEDPIIEFDINSLDSNKTIELSYRLKTDFNESAAEEIPKNIEGKFSAPILLAPEVNVSKDSFNVVEKNEPQNAFSIIGISGILPILGAIAILGFIWLFVFSMKHPLKIIHEHTGLEKVSLEEKQKENATPEADSNAKKKKSEQIKELDVVEEKLKGLRKGAN